MCGISGFLGGNFNRTQLEKAAELLHHRGPDGSAIFLEEGAGLAHNRLSIIELSALGAQPYYFEDLVLSFNGEIYNYKQVREILLKKSYHFLSDSDTEVVIKAYHFWGDACLQHFNGMFAFAIYNRKTKCMFLCRDRLGIKPLYYSLLGGLTFGSELKAVLKFHSQPEINITSLSEYFRQGYISGDKSIYNGFHKLEPATWLKFSSGKIEVNRYWATKPDIDSPPKTTDDYKEELHELMISAFKDHMISDVPVGVFLSGGIDSSLLTAILARHHGEINTFTIGFKENSFNEAPYAQAISEKLGTRHTDLILSADDAAPLLEKFYDVYDEPFADSSGIPALMVSELARRAGMKVVLSADGGDELFGGYSRYPECMALYNSIQKFPFHGTTGKALGRLAKMSWISSFHQGNLEHRLSKVSELLKSTELPEFYECFVANQSNTELSKLVGPEFVGQSTYSTSAGNDSLSTMMLWDLNYYLPDDLLVKMDRATMFKSIEGREPFLDHRIAELAFRIPNNLKVNKDGNKWILRSILADYLPTGLFERRKQGFAIPLFQWFNAELQVLCERYFSDEALRLVPVLNREEVLHEYTKYLHYRRRGKEHNMEKIWRILSFMMWWERRHVKTMETSI